MKKWIVSLITALTMTTLFTGQVEAKQTKTVIAHRGASGYAPEHTFASYDMSHYQMKADYIEIDLQMTKDHQLVAMHDETVDRTTNGSGRVGDMTLTQIKALDAGSWFNEKYPTLAKEEYVGLKVPTLKQILKRYGNQANYYIETKSPEVYPGMEKALIKTLKKQGLLTKGKLKQGHVLIQSFSKESLLKVQQLNPSIPLIQLTDKGVIPTLTDAQLDEMKQYARGIGPNYKDLTAENTQNLKNHGLIVHPYTVNTEADMRRMNSYGVDGLFTNYADVYQRIVHEK